MRMAKAMKTVKAPRSSAMKRPARKAAVPSNSCKKQSSTGSNKLTLWSPIKLSSSFVSQLELQRRRDFLKDDIERTERLLGNRRAELHTVEKELQAKEDKLNDTLGDPTGKIVNVSVQRFGTSELTVSCRFLSGDLALAVSLPLEATVGDLQSHVCQTIQWTSSECLDPQSNAMPSHAALQGCTDLILKEVGRKEVDETLIDQYTLSFRRREATDFLKKLKLPIRYEQKEHWEDGQGVGGDADIKLEFRVSKSEGVLKFGKLIDLQYNAGRERCEELVRSPKYQGKYKPPYGYFNEDCGKKGPRIIRSRGPSRIEAVNNELRMNKILTDFAEEADAFAGADWDSVTDCWHGDSLSATAEVQRRLQESGNVIKATLSWIEKSCTAGLVSAVYVRLEHGERTFHESFSEADHDSEGEASDWGCSRFDEFGDTPGRSIVEGTGLLFLKAQSGEIARLSLEKCVNDFAGSY